MFLLPRWSATGDLEESSRIARGCCPLPSSAHREQEEENHKIAGQEGIRRLVPVRTWQPRHKWLLALRTSLKEMWICAGHLWGGSGGGRAGFVGTGKAARVFLLPFWAVFRHRHVVGLGSITSSLYSNRSLSCLRNCHRNCHRNCKQIAVSRSAGSFMSFSGPWGALALTPTFSRCHRKKSLGRALEVRKSGVFVWELPVLRGHRNAALFWPASTRARRSGIGAK
ncbi:hypothetical protein B0T21DRAFT_3300 [Apiosordaria backusii]|uniref:Uncharacterized protein n=1 Tax=Apiosordaria backusii TaxID=314023 RepID=A0AA40K6P6_9PEZI|nr:hypothetical protein B0T21DRAFT_3300 [Apiosordaria backusii]